MMTTTPPQATQDEPVSETYRLDEGEREKLIALIGQAHKGKTSAFIADAILEGYSRRTEATGEARAVEMLEARAAAAKMLREIAQLPDGPASDEQKNAILDIAERHYDSHARAAEERATRAEAALRNIIAAYDRRRSIDDE